MDYGKIKADYVASKEHDKILRDSEIHRKWVCKQEVNHVYSQFIVFFKDQHGFATTLETSKVLAKYGNVTITLSEDKRKNKAEQIPIVHFNLRIPNLQVNKIIAVCEAYYPNQLTDNVLSDIEIDTNNLQYHKDFLTNKIAFRYKYIIEGDPREFLTLKELLDAV